MGIYEHFAAKEINPVLRTGFISSATGSGHVITCTARRWVVSGQLYCFQLPPARGGREACKPFTDPTSRITNVRINRAAAHRSKLSFGIFSALPSPSRLAVHKVQLCRLVIGRTKNLAERGGRGAFPPWLRQGGAFRAPARVTFGRSPKSDQKVCLKPKVSRLPARYARYSLWLCTARSRGFSFVVRIKGLSLRLRRCRWFLPR